MTHMTADQRRDDMAGVLKRVSGRRERIVLRRNKKNVAAIIPIEDLAILERLEDSLDAEDAEAALNAFRASGEEAIPYDVVRKRLC